MENLPPFVRWLIIAGLADYWLEIAAVCFTVAGVIIGWIWYGDDE